jgi:hypothetical protein
MLWWLRHPHALLAMISVLRPLHQDLANLCTSRALVSEMPKTMLAHPSKPYQCFCMHWTLGVSSTEALNTCLSYVAFRRESKAFRSSSIDKPSQKPDSVDVLFISVGWLANIRTRFVGPDCSQLRVTPYGPSGRIGLQYHFL